MAARGGNANAAAGGAGGNNAAGGGGGQGGGMNEHVEFTVKVRQAASAVQNTTHCRFWFRGTGKKWLLVVRSGFLVGEGWRRRTGPRDQRATTVI